MRRLAAAGSLAVSLALAACISTPTGPVATPQGWTALDQRIWYEESQGSRLIPYAWAAALEQPEGGGLFLDDAYLAAFRYLPRTRSDGVRLPVGFALDDRDDRGLSNTQLRWRANQGSREPWLGLNCSACHTAELAFRGQPIRVDGGPTLADFNGFMEAFNKALARTEDDPATWNRFAARVLGGDDTPANRALLKQAFGQLRFLEAETLKANAAPIVAGYGRLDAFGHIFNKVTMAAAGARGPRQRSGRSRRSSTPRRRCCSTGWTTPRGASRVRSSSADGARWRRFSGRAASPSSSRWTSPRRWRRGRGASRSRRTRNGCPSRRRAST